MTRFTKVLPAAVLVLLWVDCLAATAADEELTVPPRGTRFEFDVIDSHDAKYLWDSPAHVGKHGGLTVRPQVALGDGVIGRKDAVIPMPMLPRRRDEIGEPVRELKRRELDDAIGPRPRGRSRWARTDPVGGLVSGEHVADFGCAAACVMCHRESLERKGWPGAIPQQVLQALKIARHVAVDERDPNTGID